ncbi:M23 family metallopeptidase [Paenibacillus sp.]|jgi:hypothetical protein|uniref:M23 family metallopeptidase n=1 Tax=Paenibacillus sp. TaxID=58172 RepID=UPI00281F2859|nr:M23 family metallopeptidase [Paenibacillus sp.]MDR0269160.1 M23 family metallopeptidase [Paenibacillus sp.]
MRGSHLKKHGLSILLVVVLSTAWAMVYFIHGALGAASWWFIQFFSIVGSFLALSVVCIMCWNIIKRRRFSFSLFVLFLLSLAAAWPICWFAGAMQLAYPARLHQTKPSVSIRLPMNQPVLVGWGGDSLATNYHAIAPNQRWVYDLLVPPAGIGSEKLEDYGIYGLDVVAPAAGIVVEAQSNEADHKPGAETGGSMTGNHVYIKLDETGTYLVIAHLKQGSVRVMAGQHVDEGTFIAKAGNSGHSSEPHVHIHHQRQDPSKTNMFLAEGLPLYFRDIDGPAMPSGGMRLKEGKEVPVGDTIIPRSSGSTEENRETIK